MLRRCNYIFEIFLTSICMFHGFVNQLYHLADHPCHILHLCIDRLCHILGGLCSFLQGTIVVRQFIHSHNNHICTVFIFDCKFTHDSHTIYDRIARGLYFINGRNDALQIGFYAVKHRTVRFVQMTDGHDVANITQDNTGKLQSIFFEIILRIDAIIIFYDGTYNDNDRIDDAALYHKCPVFI